MAAGKARERSSAPPSLLASRRAAATRTSASGRAGLPPRPPPIRAPPRGPEVRCAPSASRPLAARGRVWAVRGAAARARSGARGYEKRMRPRHHPRPAQIHIKKHAARTLACRPRARRRRAVSPHRAAFWRPLPHAQRWAPRPAGAPPVIPQHAKTQKKSRNGIMREAEPGKYATSTFRGEGMNAHQSTCSRGLARGPARGHRGQRPPAKPQPPAARTPREASALTGEASEP